LAAATKRGLVREPTTIEDAMLLTMIRDHWRPSSCPKLRKGIIGNRCVNRALAQDGLMDFVRSVISCWGGLPVLFVFSIVVFFHELGHFLVARLCGVRVLVFSIGFGPELFGFNDRHGTRWKSQPWPLAAT